MLPPSAVRPLQDSVVGAVAGLTALTSTVAVKDSYALKTAAE